MRKKLLLFCTLLCLLIAGCSKEKPDAAAGTSVYYLSSTETKVEAHEVELAGTEAEEQLEPLDEVRKLIAEGVDKKAALAQVAKKRKIPKRELYNQLISEGDGSDND